MDIVRVGEGNWHNFALLMGRNWVVYARSVVRAEFLGASRDLPNLMRPPLGGRSISLIAVSWDKFVFCLVIVVLVVIVFVHLHAYHLSHVYMCVCIQDFASEWLNLASEWLSCLTVIF